MSGISKADKIINKRIKKSRVSKRFTAKRFFEYFFTYLALIMIAAIFVFPVLWLVLASFSESGSMYTFKGFFPSAYSVETFKKLFTDTKMYNYPQWFANTLIVAVGSAVLGSLLVILTAYVMSRFRFGARKGIMKTTMILGMFPSFMAMTAVYLLMTQFGMINNLFGLILIYSAGAPMGYLTQKGFFDTISNSMYEAARIDGASNLKVFIKITLPIAMPMIVYTLITSFTWPWSDFILPKLLLKDKDLYTVAVGLMSLGDTEFARFAAGSVFIAVPIIVLYFGLVKYMVNGLTAGAVKE